MILVLVAASVLAVGALFFIALPLVRPPEMEKRAIGAVSVELLARRDRIYGELRELEFDYRVGKVTDPEYSESRDRLEADAARVLRAIDFEVASIDQAIEREIVHIRSTSSACVSCGAALRVGARFCPSCGAAVRVEARS